MTCEVAPHHLFLTRDSTILNSAVRPSLGTEEDRQFLWDNLQYIDIFATDHGKSLFVNCLGIFELGSFSEVVKSGVYSSRIIINNIFK